MLLSCIVFMTFLDRRSVSTSSTNPSFWAAERGFPVIFPDYGPSESRISRTVPGCAHLRVPSVPHFPRPLFQRCRDERPKPSPALARKLGVLEQRGIGDQGDLPCPHCATRRCAVRQQGALRGRRINDRNLPG